MPPDALMSDGRPRTWTARIRCKDGDHTLELTHREVVAERLLRTSRKHSFDPDVDVDWEIDHGMWFDNGVMTVAFTGREAVVEVDHAHVRDGLQVLERTLTEQLTPQGS